MKKLTEKTYFEFARWLSFNYYQFSIPKDAWINEKDKDKTKTYTDKELLKEFINETETEKG